MFLAEIDEFGELVGPPKISLPQRFFQKLFTISIQGDEICRINLSFTNNESVVLKTTRTIQGWTKSRSKNVIVALSLHAGDKEILRHFTQTGIWELVLLPEWKGLLPIRIPVIGKIELEP